MGAARQQNEKERGSAVEAAGEARAAAEASVAAPRGPVGLLPAPRQSSEVAGIVGTVIAHLIMAAIILYIAAHPEPRKLEPVKLTVREVKKPKPPEPPKVEEKAPEPPPPPPPPKKAEKPKPKKPAEKKVASERQPKEPPKEVVKPVQGLSPDAFAPGGVGMSAPVGNTLMTEDDGTRLKASEVKELTNEDLSADPALIRSTVTSPEYTDEAVDAGIEGSFTVDVFVDASGAVTEAELKKKIGYGMDQRVIEAAKKAKFSPRKDKLGKAIAGWTEIKFRLEIP